MFQKVRRWRVEKRQKVDEAAVVRRRFVFLKIVILLFFFVLLAQLWKMQIVEGYRYQQRAENNRLRVMTVPAKRGVIYDRKGALLVRNVPSFTVSVLPADVPKESEQRIATTLENLLGIPAPNIIRMIQDRRRQQNLFTPLPIRTEVDQETALILEERHAELPGVQLVVEPTRQYLTADTSSHVLGYVGRISGQEYASLKDKGYDLNDKIGKSGVELTYESVLRGKPGREQVEVDATGRRLGVLQGEDPEPGQNLVLSVDLELQQKMTESLAQGMGDSKFAVAIAMNPQTGEVLGMVSLPSYDNNLFSGVIAEKDLNALLSDPRRPLMNHSISSMFPAGSTFKVITGLAALQEEIATARTEIVSNGLISVQDQWDPSVWHTFYDWAALGRLDFYRAVAMSSDVYFYYLAGGFEGFRGLGARRLAQYAREFALGSLTGIDLPGETQGLVPDPNWKRETWNEDWYLGDTYNFGIGQGFLLVSPMQLINAVSAVANGGNLLKPQVVREIVDARGNVMVPFARNVVRELNLSDANISIMREGMRQVVANGTGTQAQVPGVEVAGKTGTSEYGEIDPKTGYRPTHGWFVSFAPFEKPEIALVVFLESGRGAGSDGPAASAIAGKILGYYFQRQAEVKR